MSFNDLLAWIKALIEELAPAIAVMLWNYEERKIEEANHKAMNAELKLQLEKNHDKVDAKYADKSDVDILNDAIESGGGQSGSSNEADQSTASGDPKNKT